jgi:hypothetical protein
MTSIIISSPQYSASTRQAAINLRVLAKIYQGFLCAKERFVKI